MKTRSIKEAAETSGISARLIRAVTRQVGTDSLPDVYRYGASGGFPGFINYSDTVTFFKRHRAEIVELATRQAEDLGEQVIEMIAGFGCLAGHGNREDYESGRPSQARARRLAEFYPSVSRCLYGGRLTEDDTQVANALAWYTLEEVARAMIDEG